MKIEIPKNCPSCHSETVLRDGQLFCFNKSCPAKSSKKLEHYAKTMKIKGLGPKRIEELGLSSIEEIYEVTKEELESAFGEKTANKLQQEIESSKTPKASTFIAALSIPLIGNVAAKKVEKALIDGWENLTEKRLKEEGLGPKAISNLFDWMVENESMLNTLIQDHKITLKFSHPAPTTQQKGTVCITGAVAGFPNRKSVSEFLEGLGYKTVSGVSSKTDFLLDETGKSSSKRTKAEKLGIKIVNLKQLKDGNNYE